MNDEAPVLGTGRFESVLKDYYMPAIVEWLNSPLWENMLHGPPVPSSWYVERGLPVPWIYVSPKWHIRMARQFKRWLRDKRAQFGYLVGGITPSGDDWYD